MGARGKEATSGEVAAALVDLDRGPQRVKAGAWPGSLSDLDQPGLYSWWVDAAGSAGLSEGLGEELEVRRIYAGQAGATAWPSGKRSGATLRSRIGGNHIGGRARSSTFRLTLASILTEPLRLVAIGPRTLAPESEVALSRWIAEHLEVAVHPFAEADALADLEDRVLDDLDPPLNLRGRPSSVLRVRLARLRGMVSTIEQDGSDPTASAPTRPIRSAQPARRVTDGVTLHDEIATILREQGGWMKTRDLAVAVNERGRYSKRDGTAVTDFQIHGRTRKYATIFERDGSLVRLRAGRRA